MKPSLRKFALTFHVTFSVGWLGAVAAFLALSIVGLTSLDPVQVRSAYLSMNLLGLYVIVPMSLAALATGLVQALGTEWGLLRYYWVLTKFVLTLFGTVLLLMHQFTAVERAASLMSGAVAGTLPNAGRVGIQLVADASLAILLLLVATTLSIYKPWGPTRSWLRKQSLGQRSPSPQRDNQTPFGFRIFLAVIGLFVVVSLLLHLTGHGLGHHGH